MLMVVVMHIITACSNRSSIRYHMIMRSSPLPAKVGRQKGEQHKRQKQAASEAARG